MFRKKYILISLIFSSAYSLNLVSHPNDFYFGLSGGYGSTNWSRITTKDETLSVSLPEKADDKGVVVGFFAGYNIAKHYGVELMYQHYSGTKVDFAAQSEYAKPPLYPAFSMISHTQNFSILGKLRVAVGSRAEVYSVLGGTYIMRWDTLTHKKAIGGVFGAGFNLALTKHIANALEFDFATGKAGVNEVPAKSYVPFLTSINYKLMFYV